MSKYLPITLREVKAAIREEILAIQPGLFNREMENSRFRLNKYVREHDRHLEDKSQKT